jgi:CubicO group peptidase (beta-lactamase class C family)
MTNIGSGPRTLRASSQHFLRMSRFLPLLATYFAAVSLMLSTTSAHAQAVRDAVFSLKADCSLVGPFAGSYEKGWAIEYKADNTAWLTWGHGYRWQLQLMARGYRVGTQEFRGANWFVAFEQADSGRQIRITGYPTNGSKPYLVDLLTQTEAKSVSCPNAVTEEKLAAALPRLESLIDSAMSNGSTPGLAVGIVYKGQVVYLNGFGVREVGQPQCVDPDTVFQLASVSKPISSTIISSLVSDGTVKWDDTVVKYNPGFELSNPTVTSEVTIGDFFAHRSGLPGSAGNDLEAVGYNRATILYRLRFPPLAYPFRDGYEYSNFGLTEGAAAGATAAGEEWATLADRRLFEPLGMTNTSMRYADFVAQANRAHLHVFVPTKSPTSSPQCSATINTQWTPLVTRNADPQAPAGGASSNVRDMVQWLLLVLADGQYKGQQLIRKQPLEIARTPQAIRGENPFTGLGSFYGYGWGVEYLQDGVLSVSHAGAFSQGAETDVTLLPSQDLGVVSLGNAFPTGVPEAVGASLSDLARYGYVTQDWFAFWKDRFETSITIPEQKKIEEYAKPPVPYRPPLEFAAYVGTYRNNYVGKVKISVGNGVLLLTRGVQQPPLPLRHWNGNTFLSYPVPENPRLPYLVEFKECADGTVSQIVLEEFAGNGQGIDTVIRTGNGD